MRPNALFLIVALLAAAPAHAEEKQLPSVNLDEYFTDQATSIALQDKYPAGTQIGPLLAALQRSIPQMACEQFSDEVYTCSGRSLFRGDFIYKKEWVVDIKAPGGTLATIEASSNTSAVRDETELMMQ